MEEKISFGEWLRKQRRALDLSRQAFADLVGCAEVTLRRIEAGTLKPSKELANILMEKLGIPETQHPQWISFARGLSSLPTQSPLSSNKPQSNLSLSLTSFVGRENEQAQVINLVSKHRLVTLTGSGGVGKTRFARKVGEQLLENYTDGVWLVELASLNDPRLIPQTAAMLFGLITESGISYSDLLINFLRTKHVLLILDNCEHLLDACAHLADTLLKNCPNLKILITSREPLEISGEALYRVPSLGLPDLQYRLDTLRDCESVRLFEERVQLIQFDFSVTLENASSVVQICHRLDGIPLVIELAAAKVGILSTEQIARQLDESFNVLTGGSRTALPRHQTLRASMNWSWGLLTEVEQTFMRQLSVFVGGWTLEAAEAVCEGDVFELTNSLMKKSLIVLHQETGPETRYRFHESIRQYAHEKLLEAGGDETIRDKHLAYFVKLAEEAAPELFRSNQIFWLNKLDDELNNLRSALEWALATDTKSGLRLIVVSRFFWDARIHFREVEGWLAQLLDHYKQIDSLRAQALVIYSKILTDQGMLAEAQKFAKQSLEISRAISDKQAEAFSLWGLGVSIGFQADFGQGIPFIEQSLALYKSLGDKLGQAIALDWLSIDRNEPERTKAYVVESLKLYRELGHLSGIAMCLGDLAQVMIDVEDFSALRPLLDEAQVIYHQLGNQWGEAWILVLRGKLAFWQSEFQQACTYFEQAVTLYEKVDIFSWSFWARVSIAYTFLRQGNIVQAREAFKISLRQAQGGEIVIGVIYTIEGFASLLVNQELASRATCLFAWADAMREKIRDRRPPIEQKSVERDLATIRSHLDDMAFEKAHQTGRTMTTEQAIALAREE